MQMSHPWMYGDRRTAAYREGVHSFRNAAEANKHGGGFMFCPYVECRNEKDSLPQKGLLVAHQITILWRTPRFAGCATEFSPQKYFLWRTWLAAPQSSHIFMAHLDWCATEFWKNSENAKKNYKKFQKKFRKIKIWNNMKNPNYLNFFRFFAHFELIPSR